MISDSFKQDLLNRVDVVDIVGRSVQLKKAGANFSGLCPFHGEKTPSFTVSPSKQFYHCFGCGAHGNAISFLMEYQGLGYVDAVRELAQGAGLKMPEFQRERSFAGARSGEGASGASGAGAAADEGPDLYALMERAMRYYRDQLKQSPRAIDYLKGRGLTGQIAARFGIGYAPAGWQNLQAVFPEYSEAAIKEVGLVIDNEAGKRYDRFRDRIMFPIHSQRGMVIGFGGRILGAESNEEGKATGPKYLNSPETPLFQKGRELYGFSQARNPIRSAGRAVVVEGYMDVVALAQAGVDYAVATLGTATSAVHVQKLFRQTDEVVFCFDGDRAGRKAAWHALEVCLPVLADNKTVRFLFLPAEHDPDSFVRERGQEAFEHELQRATPLSGFLLDHLSSDLDLNTPEGRSRLVHEAKPLLTRIAAPALQIQLGHQLAEQAQMATQELARITGLRLSAERNFGRSFGRGDARRGAPPPARRGLEAKLERRLLRGLVAQPDRASALAGLMNTNTQEAGSPAGRAITALTQQVLQQPGMSASFLLDVFQGSEHEKPIADAYAELLELRMDDAQLEADFQSDLAAMRSALKTARIEQLKSIASEAMSAEEKIELVRLISEQAQRRDSSA